MGNALSSRFLKIHQYVWTSIHKQTHIRAHISIRVRVCSHAYTCMHMFMHMYMKTHANAPPTSHTHIYKYMLHVKHTQDVFDIYKYKHVLRCFNNYCIKTVTTSFCLVRWIIQSYRARHDMHSGTYTANIHTFLTVNT